MNSWGNTMALRVDEISLPQEGPIGGVRLTDLSKWDLVIIKGPNGAGKSTLLRALESPSDANGRVSCIDADGTRVPYAVRGKGVEQSITSVKSADLIREFRSMKEPLALAASVTRDAHEQRLLDDLFKWLTKQQPTAAEAEPHEIQMLTATFIELDRRCGTSPRTIDEYERRGRQLAEGLGRPWQRPPLLPDEKRQQYELTLRPTNRHLAGSGDVTRVLNNLKNVLPAEGSQASTLTRRSSAEAELHTLCSEAQLELASTVSPPKDETPADRVRSLRSALGTAREAAQQTIEAMGRLDECRRIALKWMSDPTVDAGAQSSCPVCEQTIDPASVQERLRQKCGDAGPEQQRWSAKRDRLARLDRDLESALSRFDQAAAAVRREHDAYTTAIRSASSDLRPATGWDAPVLAAAAPLQRACNEWLTAHGSHATDASVAALSAIRDQAAVQANQLAADDRALNAGLEQSHANFKSLEALGALLALRERLDAIPWTVNVAEVEAQKRRAAQTDLWLSTLGEMSRDLRDHQATAAQRVVDDPGVQERFQRLLQRIVRTQPQLAQLTFRGDRLEAGGIDCSDELSEGQRVLVNIAAVIAVVGKVAGMPAHLPGWIAFDEPTNGLDNESRGAVAEYLGSITLNDLSSQIFIASFENEFSKHLIDHAKRSGRRILEVELPPFVPGQQVLPKRREIQEVA